MSLADILAAMPDAPDIADEEFESHAVDSVSLVLTSSASARGVLLASYILYIACMVLCFSPGVGAGYRCQCARSFVEVPWLFLVFWTTDVKPTSSKKTSYAVLSQLSRNLKIFQSND